MKVSVIAESGYPEALLGLGLSYGLTSGMQVITSGSLVDKLQCLANKLAHKDGGHNKFLESLVVWIDITASRDFWQEFDTYRVGVTKQSESTMHTLTKRELSLDDFEEGTDQRAIDIVNEYIRAKDWKGAKKNLPEGFLQRRLVCTNYKALRGMLWQRENHRLKLWDTFRNSVLLGVEHPHLLVKESKEDEE